MKGKRYEFINEGFINEGFIKEFINDMNYNL